MSAAASALEQKITDVLSSIPSWARSKVNRRGSSYTIIPDDYWDNAVPALTKAGHSIAAHTLGMMMRLSWGKKGLRGEAGPEWIPMPVQELTERLGSNRNTTSINLRALVAAGVLEERKNSRDKRVSDYRVVVDRLAKLNQKAFRDKYEELVSEGLQPVQDNKADEAEDDEEDLARTSPPAGSGFVVRFGKRSMPAAQVAQEAHLCQTCTNHFLEYVEGAQNAPVATAIPENVSNENGALDAKQCKSNVHNSLESPPPESAMIPRIREAMARCFSTRLASPPPEKMLTQIADKLESAGADIDTFFTRVENRKAQVKSWGFLLHLADDAAGTARLTRAAAEAKEPKPEPELSPTEQLRVYATEWIRECDARSAPIEITRLFEQLNDQAGALARDPQRMWAAISRAQREGAAWAAQGLGETKRKQVKMSAEKSGRDESLFILAAARLPQFGGTS